MMMMMMMSHQPWPWPCHFLDGFLQWWATVDLQKLQLFVVYGCSLSELLSARYLEKLGTSVLIAGMHRKIDFIDKWTQFVRPVTHYKPHASHAEFTKRRNKQASQYTIVINIQFLHSICIQLVTKRRIHTSGTPWYDCNIGLYVHSVS